MNNKYDTTLKLSCMEAALEGAIDDDDEIEDIFLSGRSISAQDLTDEELEEIINSLPESIDDGGEYIDEDEDDALDSIKESDCHCGNDEDDNDDDEDDDEDFNDTLIYDEFSLI